MKLDIVTIDSMSAGSLDLPEAIFGLEPRSDILHRMVRWQLAKRRAGTHQAKTRGEVKATSKKMYKQKGTGGARHGNKAAPQFRGGGKAFGPRSRSHEHGLPKKVRALALRHALSAKAKASEIVVLERASVPEPKTAGLKARLGKLGLASALIVDGHEIEQNFELAARNIPEIDVLPIQGINVYDILRCKKLVLTKAALEALEKRFADAEPAEVSP